MNHVLSFFHSRWVLSPWLDSSGVLRAHESLMEQGDVWMLENLNLFELEWTSIECVASLLASGGEIHWAEFDCNMRPRFNPWVGKILWRRAEQPTPVFLPGESHGQRSLAGYRPWEGHKEADTTETKWKTGTKWNKTQGRDLPDSRSCSTWRLLLTSHLNPSLQPQSWKWLSS